MHGSDCKCPCCERMGKIPGILWIALAALALMTLGRALWYLRGVLHTGRDDVALVEAILCGALFVGLFYGHRWAYWLTFVFVLVEVAIGFHWHWHGALRNLLMDLLVLLPVLICRDYFPSPEAWPAYTAQRWSSEAEKPEGEKPADEESKG
ncbi:MAG: hypothetical protein NTW86_03365 [Candidatus Sumerlaeota bacterium]|nr:hypothetical protein [Candidatus Sumerlaeota bacterium]